MHRSPARFRALAWSALVGLLIGLCPPGAIAVDASPGAPSLGNQPHHAHAGHAECCQPDCCSLALRAVGKNVAAAALHGLETAISDAVGRPERSIESGGPEAPPPGPPGLATPLLR